MVSSVATATVSVIVIVILFIATDWDCHFHFDSMIVTFSLNKLNYQFNFITTCRTP